MKTEVMGESGVSVMNRQARTDTARTQYSVQLENIRRIVETITETEYDTDKNVVEKVTKTERTIEQDTKVDIAEEGEKGLSVYAEEGLVRYDDMGVMMEGASEVESVGSQESFGKWFGIIFGVGIFVLVLVLWNWLKKRLNL